MPDSVQLALKELRPIDDAQAAGMTTPATHDQLIRAIIATTAGDTPCTTPRRHWNRRPVILAAALVMTATVLVVALPGLLSGGGSATQPQSARAEILRRIAGVLAPGQDSIMIETRTERLLESGSFAGGTRSVLLRTITQTSRTGREQRVFAVASDLHRGYQLLLSHDRTEIYDPSDNTICNAPAHLALTGLSFQPSDATLFARELHAHLYSLRGRSRVDGRPALKLEPVRPRVRVGKLGYRLLPTVYVSPRTYYPIRAVVMAPPGARAVRTAVVDWLVFRVLPATATNKRLLSLTARHPAARVTDSRAVCARIWAAARER